MLATPKGQQKLLIKLAGRKRQEKPGSSVTVWDLHFFLPETNTILSYVNKSIREFFWYLLLNKTSPYRQDLQVGWPLEPSFDTFVTTESSGGR